MQHKHHWLLGAALACGTIGFSATTSAFGADDPNAAKPASDAGRTVAGALDSSKSLALPSGIKLKDDQVKATKLAETVAEVTEAAMTKDGFKDIVERFVDQDRNRIGEAGKLDNTQLDGRIDELTKVWKEKYNQKFDIDTDNVFASAQSVEGEIEDPAAVASNWPVPATTLGQVGAAVQGAANDAANAAGVAQPAAGTVDKDTKTQGNIEKGRNVAILRIPGEAGMPAIDVSLIHEAGGWKIDVPNTRSAQQIHDDLLKHLTMAGEQSGQWPGDVNAAYRAMTHHVLMGIYGIDMPKAAQGG